MNYAKQYHGMWAHHIGLSSASCHSIEVIKAISTLARHDIVGNGILELCRENSSQVVKWHLMKLLIECWNRELAVWVVVWGYIVAMREKRCFRHYACCTSMDVVLFMYNEWFTWCRLLLALALASYIALLMTMASYS